MYIPQIADLKHALNDIAGFEDLLNSGAFPDLSRDLVDAVLSEAGRFAQEVLAPLNRTGDTEGCRFEPESHAVTTAAGWKEAYRQWAEAGWAALPCPEHYGGQGLPISIGLAVQELWNTAASAYGIGTLLTQGAVEAIAAHGNSGLKDKYLPKMVSGEWTGTMNLTESHSGSDLGTLKARAERHNDGSYRITGTKIFITYGEHDLTENIIHLVLARLPDAPEGTRGLSLFLVPKFLVNDDGTIAERNDVKCIGMEHKLGIHGSPTCTLQFGDDGGATGWLIGEENRGLNCMFTMMNNARLHVGMQGVAVAEMAFQQALSYAKERKQGRKPGHEASVAIIEHGDVRRMLLDMRAKTAAARAICFQTAKALDLADHGRDEDEKRANAALSALLTPVAKAFGTDIGIEVASTGIQVHGGMGFIEESGAAQHYRDVRITAIYEGTNGIHAIDLVKRKLSLEHGQTIKSYIAEISGLADALKLEAAEELSMIGSSLRGAVSALTEATEWLGQKLRDDPETALNCATPYLRLFGLTAGAAGLARGVLALNRRNDTPDTARHSEIALHFTQNHLPMTSALRDIICNAAGRLPDPASSAFEL